MVATSSWWPQVLGGHEPSVPVSPRWPQALGGTCMAGGHCPAPKPPVAPQRSPRTHHALTPTPAQGARFFHECQFPSGASSRWNILAPLMQFPPLTEISFQSEPAAPSTCSLINLCDFNELNSKLLFYSRMKFHHIHNSYFISDICC